MSRTIKTNSISGVITKAQIKPLIEVVEEKFGVPFALPKKNQESILGKFLVRNEGRSLYSVHKIVE